MAWLVGINVLWSQTLHTSHVHCGGGGQLKYQRSMSKERPLLYYAAVTNLWRGRSRTSARCQKKDKEHSGACPQLPFIPSQYTASRGVAN
ncbi:hypothetical protein EDD21DRAFT_141668 [Dissophora ornata]|nr:hypothetical protein EDD21DRAFT_141668 [Dissophora ornata]